MTAYRNRLAWLLTLLCLVAGSRPAAAIDTVIRKSTTSPLRGKITIVAKTGITLKPTVGEAVTVAANDIGDIRWDGEPVKLITARGADRAGRFEQALKSYTEALADSKVKGANIRLDLQFLVARATAGQALAGAGKLEDARGALEKFLAAGADSFRYFDAVRLLGRVHLAAGDHDKAKTQFATLAVAPAPLVDFQLAGQSALARVLLAEDDVDGALAAYRSVIDKSKDATAGPVVAERYRAVLGKSTCLLRKTDKASYEQALKDLEGVLAQAADEDVEVLAEGYLRQGDCLRLLGRQKAAVLAYLHVDLLFAAQQQQHAEALFQLGSLWIAVGRPDRATGARERLRSDYPQSPWTKKLGG